MQEIAAPQLTAGNAGASHEDGGGRGGAAGGHAKRNRRKGRVEKKEQRTSCAGVAEQSVSSTSLPRTEEAAASKREVANTQNGKGRAKQKQTDARPRKRGSGRTGAGHASVQTTQSADSPGAGPPQEQEDMSELAVTLRSLVETRMAREADAISTPADVHAQPSNGLDKAAVAPRIDASAALAERATQKKAENRKKKKERAKAAAKLDAAGSGEAQRQLEISQQQGGKSERALVLTDQLASGTYDCPVCCERVRGKHEVWSCGTCGCVVHIACLRKWITSAMNTPNCQSADDVPSWRCVACAQPHFETRQQIAYYCFCGKVRNPELRPGVLAHSCGDVCGRPLGGTMVDEARISGSGSSLVCPHRCVELCHPGRCAPCTKMLPVMPCYCGKSVVQPRRCADQTADREAGLLSCGEICGRQVAHCGHMCLQPCHPGECSSCAVATSITCDCGKSSIDVPCEMSSMPFMCGKHCGRPLSCGNHTCQLMCGHRRESESDFGGSSLAEDCGVCPRDPSFSTPCPCGKSVLTVEDQMRAGRKTCMDRVPGCGQKCGAPLNCIGAHTCSLPCGHEGDSHEKCEEVMSLPCRCGAKLFSDVACARPPAELMTLLLCDTLCDNALDCRQHRCRAMCCPLRNTAGTGGKSGLSVVNRKGRYKNARLAWLVDRVRQLNWETQSSSRATAQVSHTCSRVCDKLLNCGKHRCDLVCGSREHVMSGGGTGGTCPPCGILIHDEPLMCACGAEVVRAPYRCGTARPVCDRDCGIERPGCGHVARVPCHLLSFPDAAAERCMEIVPKTCVGGHGDVRYVPCFTQQIRCARPCGRALSCGVHACTLSCHAPDEGCMSSGETCSSQCLLPRLNGSCRHPCLEQCHGANTPCPDVICKYPVDVCCPCKRRRAKMQCLVGGGNDGGSDFNATSLKSTTDSKHVFQEAGTRYLVRLACDEECERIERNNEFAEALGVDPTLRDHSSGGTGAGSAAPLTFSSFLMESASRDLAFIRQVEIVFASLVRSEMNQGRAQETFEGLPSIQRVLLHELATHYGLATSSVGPQCARVLRVFVPKPKDSSALHIPDPTLSELYLQKRTRDKQLRTSRSHRMLTLTLRVSAATGAQCAGDMNDTLAKTVAECRTLLKAHTGAYTIYSSMAVEGDASRVQVIIEFSTPERRQAAQMSLAARSGVHVAPLVESDVFELDTASRATATLSKSAWDE
ncbi:NF-X1-type zinc finger protein NFXL1 [Porphyridium purpureum]|uniref:NF-X1-type zinc finger protein NFXL1 n=1 Tax=Porphyridium purpureum TaxID=35688 RepID=A0A5J4YK44_PORPP|nr:NF-X1-type zinc finger protein NFXL1 [Porphyridium purpureum]|eukprot:POR9510..scf244_11